MDHGFDILFEIILIIVKAHLIIILILAISYLLEKLIGLKLFITFFRWKKSKRNAEIYLNGHTFLYFVVILLTFVFSDKGIYFEYNINTISAFILMVIPLLMIFRKLHSKYQGIDVTREDDELP